MQTDYLVEAAIEARKKSYCPYSHFAVGAALEGQSGKIYQGCNVENAAFGVTNCAERTALFSAIAQGERKFKRIAIVGGKAGKPCTEICTPCGICRQALSEFVVNKDFQITLAAKDHDIINCTLEDLLPGSFGPDNLS